MMKRSYWAILAMVPAVALAQTTAKDVGKQAGEAWDTVKSYTVEKKDEAVAHGKKLVRDADRGITRLEGQAAKASGDAKAQAQQELKDLRAKRAQAAKKLDEMGKASAGAWDEAKNGFADAYRDLRQATERAAAKLK